MIAAAHVPSMMQESVKLNRSYLEPSERIAEILFGLIMFLTFTGSLRVTSAGPDDVNTMLKAALGCNLAWGIIDAVLFCMHRRAETGRNLLVYRALRDAADPKHAHRLIADELPPLVASVLQPSEIDAISQRLRQLPEPAAHSGLRRADWLAALGVFLLVVVSMFPVTLPFMFMQDPMLALHVSNAIAIGMLFGMGYAYGRSIRENPWVRGVGMVILGVLLVALANALGG